MLSAIIVVAVYTCR